MFTSVNRDYFDHDDSILSCKSFSSDHKQHQVHHQHNHHQFSLFNLPSPYPFQCFSDDFDYQERPSLNLDLDLDLILFHHQQLQLQLQQQQKQQQQQQDTVDFVCGKDQNETRAAFPAVPGMRSSKKDRHSKITTAHGPRDRRMRLSLEVAREFFDLQDMLGFDKASKTVDWLISQSKSAIREIIKKVKGSGGDSGIAVSCNSDCKIGHDRNSDGDGGDQTAESSAGRKKSNIVRKSRKSNSHRWSTSTTPESRRKARERARQRTLEKIWKRRLENSRLNPRKPCSSPLETREESGDGVRTGTTGSNLEILTEYKEIATGQINVDVSSDLVCSKQSPEMASSSNLNLQEIGIPPFVSPIIYVPLSFFFFFFSFFVIFHNHTLSFKIT